MTRAELISNIKTRYKQNTTALDTLIGSWIDEGYRVIARKFPWKQLIKSVTLPLTAGTEEYILPSDWFRMVPNSVLYYQDASNVSPDYPGTPLLEIASNQVGYYSALVQFTWPTIYAITSSSTAPGRMNLYVGPPFSQTGSVLLYQYYYQPAAYGETAGDVPEVSDYLMYYTLARLAGYFGKTEDMTTFDQLARRHFGGSFVQIANG